MTFPDALDGQARLNAAIASGARSFDPIRSIMGLSSIVPCDNVFKVWVTAEIAKEWLELNVLNRKLSPAKVKQWKNRLRCGSMKTTHQGIAFDEEGFLLDGQHRLTAIYETGIAVELVVFVGVPRSVFSAIDAEVYQRQASQFMKRKYPTFRQGACKYLGPLTDDTDATVVEFSGVYALNQSVTKTFELSLDWNEAMSDAIVCGAVAANKDVGIKPSPHIAILTLASQTEYADKIEAWLEGVGSPVGHEADDPRLILREKFRRNPKPTRREAYGWIVKAWNAWALEEPISMLRLGVNEQIPDVVGWEN